ncbi:30S ribosome-binding factor RbfA [Candidatus Electronema sp. PJ]|uniref:30S ribosome-binding factor RbfA n=1 Tax=Candidatus Electronema sp. PJ TaxID=3401572 RepID=UPI003AA803F0
MIRQDFNFTLPGLGRPKSTRPERIGEAVLQELSVLLRQEARDARLARVAFSRAQVTPDLKQAKVWFTVPEGFNATEVLKALRKAGGFFRSHLARTLNMRCTPELLFFHDRQNEEMERIERLFREINQEQKTEDSGESE